MAAVLFPKPEVVLSQPWIEISVSGVCVMRNKAALLCNVYRPGGASASDLFS